MKMEPFAQSFKQELSAILNYWSQFSVDEQYGGFHGQIDNDNIVTSQQPKGSVLNARILWSFSAAYNCNPEPAYLELAKRSFEYIANHFIDKEFGGVYWSVDYLGNPLDTKKQIYALAFTIYGLTEYVKACKDERALNYAIALYQAIEQYSFDPVNGGYLEALSRDWKDAGDLRLSDKDANEKKTMNTHLHILEAYGNLYKVWPDSNLSEQIRNLLTIFSEHIVDQETYHLILFFDESWNAKSNIVSFGHDIEASWLLLEAAEALGDEDLIQTFKDLALKMAIASAEGLDEDGGMNYERQLNHWNKEKHWWVQAEAMVGFLNAFQITGERRFYDRFLSCWNFTQKHIIDHKNGEWFWGVEDDYSVMPGEDKAGFWKCPYHNSRACMEVLNRLNSIKILKTFRK
jgi:cellobiose epimerase